jgi:5'-nucleotidase, C-terminal domain
MRVLLVDDDRELADTSAGSPHCLTKRGNQPMPFFRIVAVGDRALLGRWHLTQPVGSRVRNLRCRGAPLRDDEPLRIALSSYRAAGSAGYSMFRGAKVVYRSGRAIRDLLAEYWGARGRLPEKPDDNWRLRPRAA